MNDKPKSILNVDKAITWTNDVSVHWDIYASAGIKKFPEKLKYWSLHYISLEWRQFAYHVFS